MPMGQQKLSYDLSPKLQKSDILNPTSYTQTLPFDQSEVRL